jgi:hypothetical protein
MKENIVIRSWELITEFHSLKKLNFFPSFVGMLWLLLILIYQITFTYVYIFKQKDQVFSVIAQFVHSDFFVETLITLGIIFLLYMILEPIASGAMIEMMSSYRKTWGKDPHRTFQGIFDGLRHFLPIFEVHNMTAVFRPLSIITFYILLLRVFGSAFATSISIVMIIYLIFAFCINMCFAYAKFFIVFEWRWALESLSASTGMAVRHIGITGQLYFTMILLYLRTIIVAVIFLVLPFVISSVVAFFTIMSVKLILLTIFCIISIVLFIFIVHLNSTLEIFVEATWYEAYMLCKKIDTSYHGGSHPADTHSGDHHMGDHIDWHATNHKNDAHHEGGHH